MKVDKNKEICQRNELWLLIKKVSEHYKGDNKEWLKEYARTILLNNSMDAALRCFRDLAIFCKKY